MVASSVEEYCKEYSLQLPLRYVLWGGLSLGEVADETSVALCMPMQKSSHQQYEGACWCFRLPERVLRWKLVAAAPREIWGA